MDTSREWDEDELKKLSFGDRVIVPSGEEGMVTELDGEEYCVAGDVQLGWFRAEELILAK